MTGYCNLKEKSLDRCLMGARSGRSPRPVVRQTMALMNALSVLIYCAGGKIEKNEMDWACGAYG